MKNRCVLYKLDRANYQPQFENRNCVFIWYYDENKFMQHLKTYSGLGYNILIKNSRYNLCCISAKRFKNNIYLTYAIYKVKLHIALNVEIIQILYVTIILYLNMFLCM